MKELMNVKPTGLPPGADPQQMAAEAESDQPTAEEQAIYEKFMMRAGAFIHGEQTQAAVLDMINQPSEPVHVNVGKAAAKIVQLVQQSAESAGQSIPESVLWGAGEEIVEELMNTGVEAKLFPFEGDSEEAQRVTEMALLEAVKAYGEDLLAGPDGEQISAHAQDEYAREVAREVDAGEADPEFLAAMEQQQQSPEFAMPNPVAAGVNKAVNNE